MIFFEIAQEGGGEEKVLQSLFRACSYKYAASSE